MKEDLSNHQAEILKRLKQKANKARIFNYIIKDRVTDTIKLDDPVIEVCKTWGAARKLLIKLNHKRLTRPAYVQLVNVAGGTEMLVHKDGITLT